ncbi:MAG: lantibiotic dehydratase [Planctomycetaceae bacterium]
MAESIPQHISRFPIERPTVGTPDWTWSTFFNSQRLWQHLHNFAQNSYFVPTARSTDPPGGLRYAESRIVGNARNHRLVVVDETDYLLATIERARAGARLGDLAAALVDNEITQDDAEAYLAELIDSQILVSELEPPVTGPEQISHLIEQLTLHRPVNEITQRLCELRDGMSQLDHNQTANTPDAYRRLADSLQKFPSSHPVVEAVPSRPDPSRRSSLTR